MPGARKIESRSVNKIYLVRYTCENTRRRIEGAQMWLVTRERRILGSENGDRGRATEGGRKRAKRRERERELAAEFVDGLLHVCQHVYVSR